ERLQPRRRMADSSSGDDPQAARARRVEPAAVLALLRRIEVALHFGVQPLGPDHARGGDQLLGRPRRQRDQPPAKIGELRESHLALTLLAPVVSGGEKAAEILVALPIFAEERERPGALRLYFGAHQRPQPGVLGR